MSLLEELYRIQEPIEGDDSNKEGKEDVGVVAGDFVNMEGSLDKLPSGRRKATFWNAWKRRFFKLKDGYLYCYQVVGKKKNLTQLPLKNVNFPQLQNSQLEKPNIILELVGGQLEMDNNMISVDDGVYVFYSSLINCKFDLIILVFDEIEGKLRGGKRQRQSRN